MTFFFGYCEKSSVVFYLISQFKEDVLFLDLRKGILGKPSVNNIKVNHPTLHNAYAYTTSAYV